MTEKQIYKLLVLPDMQMPHHDQRSIQAMYNYFTDAKPAYDEVLQLGDFLDYDYISKWTKGNMRFLEGKRFLFDYEQTNVWLDDFQARMRALNPDMKFTMLQGNHDIRVEKYLDVHPEMIGLLEMEEQLRFKERGIEYHKTWESKIPYMVGKAGFIHGDAVGSNHAKKMAQNYSDMNIFYGHTHDIMSYSQPSRGRNTKVAQSLGTLSRYDLSYIGKRPSNWAQAFTEFYIEQSTGRFNYYVTRIFANKFIHSNGKVYGA